MARATGFCCTCWNPVSSGCTVSVLRISSRNRGTCIKRNPPSSSDSYVMPTLWAARRRDAEGQDAFMLRYQEISSCMYHCAYVLLYAVLLCAVPDGVLLTRTNVRQQGNERQMPSVIMTQLIYQGRAFKTQGNCCSAPHQQPASSSRSWYLAAVYISR